MKSEEVPYASVVIPSYNSEKTIFACLNSVLNQKTNSNYEVIVADSSMDKTPDLIKEHFPQVRLIHSKKRMYRGKARNIGIRQAKGRIIVCLDSDCLVSDDWLNKTYGAHEKYDVVGARILNGNPKSILGWSIFLFEFCEWIGKKDRVMKLLLSYNVSYKRRIFNEYGFFPEHSSINEDLIFHTSIKEKLFFSGRIAVKHVNRTSLFEIIEHCFRLGEGAALARKKHRLLPGSFFVRYLVLIPLLPFCRFSLSFYRSMCAGYFWFFLIASPFIFVDAVSYSLGFFVSAMRKNADSD